MADDATDDRDPDQDDAAEEPRGASPTGFADTGRIGAFSRPTTSVAGTHAPDVPGTPHRWDEREQPPTEEQD